MSKKTNKMAFYLIPLGIAINFVFGEIVLLLGLPIYLDTVGTIIVGALCGPMYSIITAVATCGLLCITSPETLFYLGGYLASGILVGVMGEAGMVQGDRQNHLFRSAAGMCGRASGFLYDHDNIRGIYGVPLGDCHGICC